MTTPMTPEQQQAVADRDAQIIAWLIKKSVEYRGLPRSRQEPAADVLVRMADKISRGAVRGPETASPWERAVAGLNALVDADVIFHVEPDGHISAPFSDEHIEWDLKARRWVLTHDDEDEVVTSTPVDDPHGPVSFTELAIGNRIRFVTTDNGFGGMGEIWRTGTITRITAKTIAVDCDENLLGDTAVLRHAEWSARAVHRAPAEGPHDSPLLPGACDACGDTPEKWCPDCAACRQGCHGGHEGNPCTHPRAPWGGAS